MTKFIMLCGLPGSGKSKFAKELSKKGFNIHSSDSIRKELFEDENNQQNNDFVFKTLHGRIRTDLKNGQNTICDATNINWWHRRLFLNEIKDIPCNKICILFATPYEKCLENNSRRKRSVPEEVIENMYKNFNMPCYFEGWDKIDIIWNFNKRKYNLIKYVSSLYNFNQENSNHKYSLGEHLVKCSEYLSEKYPFDGKLRIAGMVHDIGKSFVKDNYNYQNISAYNSLFYLKGKPMKLHDKDIIDIIGIVQWHMQPYLMKENKTIEKYRNIWGEDFYNLIMKLHEADEHTH